MLNEPNSLLGGVLHQNRGVLSVLKPLDNIATGGLVQLIAAGLSGHATPSQKLALAMTMGGGGEGKFMHPEPKYIGKDAAWDAQKLVDQHVFDGHNGIMTNRTKPNINMIEAAKMKANDSGALMDIENSAIANASDWFGTGTVNSSQLSGMSHTGQWPDFGMRRPPKEPSTLTPFPSTPKSPTQKLAEATAKAKRNVAGVPYNLGDLPGKPINNMAELMTTTKPKGSLWRLPSKLGLYPDTQARIGQKIRLSPLQRPFAQETALGRPGGRIPLQNQLMFNYLYNHRN